ncbi:hypothetical protein [Lactobacillus kullabergensis]|uniref:hypothetical protein n=1 Tax=Lactobacillus kullabergensis TaxID=1218493 RepID=UPI0005F93249|nr:hypothetical protein [Lactobacillus kullabergensis]
MLLNGKEVNNLIIGGHRFTRDDLAGRKVMLLKNYYDGTYLAIDKNNELHLTDPYPGKYVSSGSTWTILTTLGKYICIGVAWVDPADVKFID